MKEFRSIVVLTGAGISAESGIGTFRDLGGLWGRHRVEDVASPEGFSRDPELVHRFYNLRRRTLLSGDIHPNPAHRALARLEGGFTGDFLLVTQNIDDLHERAGSGDPVHMHGELLKARCAACGAVRGISVDLGNEDACAQCGRHGLMRPHVVWFGEMPMEMDRILPRLEQCDLFVAIGTSGQVYPAAGFVDVARRAGAYTVELNLERTGVVDEFDESIQGPAGETVPPFTEGLLRGGDAALSGAARRPPDSNRGRGR
ncbi:MAG: Sir2 family NAD+-dependent deacetylase [Gammaproteobacteria bacterium]|nr:Sir2 family NAD+-dependent deacetylase [Gammaproteobacteria bacterium]